MTGTPDEIPLLCDAIPDPHQLAELAGIDVDEIDDDVDDEGASP